MGQIGKNLSEEDAYALGRAFASFVTLETPSKTTRTVCVGYDGRVSSPALSKSLIRGLKDGGMHVVSVGLGPTPMLYFSVKHLNAEAGIMVTGSHNPPDYNGFKMTLNKSPVFGETIQKIGQISASGAQRIHQNIGMFNGHSRICFAMCDKQRAIMQHWH